MRHTCGSPPSTLRSFVAGERWGARGGWRGGRRSRFGAMRFLRVLRVPDCRRGEGGARVSAGEAGTSDARELPDGPGCLWTGSDAGTIRPYWAAPTNPASTRRARTTVQQAPAELE